MEKFIESLADRPLMLVLSVMAFGTVIAAAAMFVTEKLRKLDDAADPLADMGAALLGYTGPDGRVGGVPARISVGPVRSRSRTVGYSAVLKYTVTNPNGLRLALHRAGLLYRPLKALPPEVKEVPQALAEAGYTLRLEPGLMAPLYAGKLAALGPLLEENIMEFSLEGGTLTIELQASGLWPDARIRQLAEAGAETAKAFMQ